MKVAHLSHLVCPQCARELILARIDHREGDRIRAGTLQCPGCTREFPILRSIPRFVPEANYASNFGYQWNIHARTQYDSYSGVSASETRFFNETRWPRDLSGQMVLEVGSGSGRFTEQAASTGATIVSFDYSDAVEANFASNGDRENVLIIQASLYEIPLRLGFFDKLFCFGVLQHTPDVEKSLLNLPRYLKPGGQLVADIYRKTSGVNGLLIPKYWVRPVTRRMPPQRLYAWCRRYVTLMWPISRKVVARLPRGKALNWRMLIPDYTVEFQLREEMAKEWAILDLFDMLGPMYDYPQTLETVRKWTTKMPLSDVQVAYGYNGIEIHGVKV